MKSGRRYNNQRKLNMKKVVGVIVAMAVLAMVVVSIKMLLQPKTEEQLSTKLYYFSAYRDKKWGVINQSGNEIIPFVYDEMIIVPDSSKDIFITMTNVDLEKGTYKTKAFNRKNEAIFTDYETIEAIDNFDSSENLWYEENVLKVKKDEKYGLINYNGAEILECKYDDIYSLKGTKNSLVLKQNEKIGLANNLGDIVVPVEYNNIISASNDYNDGYIVTNNENKQGLIGVNKKPILDVTYDEIKLVSKNELYVVKEEGKLKIINKEKETILENDFDECSQIDGDILVLRKGNNYGAVKTSKEEKIPFEYQELKSIGNNHFIAKKDDKYGIIDLENKTVIEFKYSYINQRENTDFVEAEKSATETDVYNNNMELKLTGIVSEVNTEKGYISIRIGNEQKYYNFKFEEKTSADLFTNHSLYLTKKDGKYGYKDKNGKLVVDYIYDDAREQNEYGYCSVKKGNVWGSLNKEGNVSCNPYVNLDNNLVIDFIGNWHLAEDLNLHYYEK